MSVPEFSVATGIPKDRIYKWKQQGTSPKAEDEKTIQAWINGETVENSPQSAAVAGIKAESLDPAGLLEVLKNVSMGHKEVCASIPILADNERMILLKMPTEGVREDKNLADPEILVRVVQVLAEISSGQLKYRSFDEAMRELGIRFELHKSYKGNPKGTQPSVSKLNTDGA